MISQQQLIAGMSAAALIVLGSASTPALAQDAPTGAKPAASASSQNGEMDARAVALVKRMSAYLAGMKAFSVRARNTTEVVLADGQKLQIEGDSDVLVQRPNHLYSKRVGQLADTELYYDGSSVTLFGPKSLFYATAPVPSTIDGMLDDVREKLNIQPPGADLLYSDVYDGLMADVTKAMYVGPATVGSVKTIHLAFRGQAVDWQIWIEDGDRPLPRKYVITTKSMAGAPEFEVELSDWNLSPKVNEATFRFTPPAGAKKIQFLNTPTTAQSRQ